MTTDDLEMQVGKVYDVQHLRKGSFRIRVINVSSVWVDAEIVDGIAEQVSMSDATVGDAISLRKSLMTWNVREVLR